MFSCANFRHAMCGPKRVATGNEILKERLIQLLTCFEVSDRSKSLFRVEQNAACGSSFMIA